MRSIELSQVMTLLLAVAVIAGCGGPASETAAPEASNPNTKRDIYPDPTAIVAEGITAAVASWVAERSEDGTFDIPPRGGYDVAGVLESFHTVHQKDADTYTVCVDFVDGDDTYDVDFFIDRKVEGLTVRDAYLHKINGEVVSG